MTLNLRTYKDKDGYVYIFPADYSVEQLEELISNPLPVEDAEKIQNIQDADARFLLSQLANKTPQEIYTAMQNAMDGWATLADARADLREWLPLMAAIIAWKV